MSQEETEIINRVEKSGLITLDLGDYYSPGERSVLDISSWLWEGLILKEKEFRESVKEYDWSSYQDKYVSVYCSTDAIIPDWAFMLIASELIGIAKKFVHGEPSVLNTLLFENAISKIDGKQFLDKRVLIKGCGDLKIPSAAYMMMVDKLQPYVKSLMFGEACSSVPVYKKK